jgi:RNA polymerase sigma factor (sigma-70 family)
VSRTVSESADESQSARAAEACSGPQASHLPELDPDYKLLEAWRAGDVSAGEDLFRRHYDVLYRFFHNKLSHDIDDLVQNVLLALLNNPRGFEQRGTFKAYMLGVARFQLYDVYRKRQRENARLEFTTVTAHDLEPSPSQCVVARGEERLLLEALRRMPVDLQIALELTYWEAISAPEIAQVLGIPPDTVYSRVRRGKELLKKQLEAMSTEPRLLESTQTDLEAWARSIRKRTPAGESARRAKSRPLP